MMCRDEAVGLLDEYSIPYRDWSKSNGNSLEKMLESIAKGEVFLTVEKVGSEMRVIRNVNVAVITLRHRVHWRYLELAEDYQTLPSGEIKKRAHIFDGSIGEKIETANGETVEGACRRALAEELAGVNDHETLGTYAPGFADPANYTLEPWRGKSPWTPTNPWTGTEVTSLISSDWCPRLLGRFYRHHMLCSIKNPDLFKPEYIEHHDGKFTHFKWVAF